ncbi:hypothetical protein BLS_003467 [Venturia inaequalis]|uniref:DUF7492 domain-containing protein n=1 Tax=Venturia inaequalis TaxID=5025 RepID=A0A8H3UQE2_VENIN|nr:hypothetical protein BLS_003467 [Venturia inaequalis]KAE9986260.1 hypothetical protein EG328_006263 [Venturia inaequalis]RDI79818.1 hypothetical protein Vi05172_g10168 [Venturia inaequalis]
MRSSLSCSAAAALLFAGASAHTWVEQMSVIGDNGSYVGAPGYSRGYVPRGGKFADPMMSYLIPKNDGSGRIRINQGDLLCRPEQQQANSNPSDYPQLRALPGSHVAARYLENGHVTLPQAQMAKPGSGGLIYMYATTNPDPNMKMPDIFKWTPKGDLATGRLLAVNTYDDGRCYQVNPASPMSMERQAKFPNPPVGQPPTATHESWCETNFQIPEDAKAGTLAVYWVWQWPSLPDMNPNGPLGKDEMYTTCLDVQVVTDKSTIMQAVSGKVLDGFQDPRTKTVDQYKERAANITIPSNPAFYGPNSNFTLVASSGAPTAPPPATSAPAAMPSGPVGPYGPSMSLTTFTRTNFVTVTSIMGAAGSTGAAAPTGTIGKRSLRFRGY